MTTPTRIVVDVQTGEQTIVELTPEEIAEIENRPPVPVPVPQQVPMWAVRTILQNDGLFDQAQALVSASTDNALKNVWEYGNFADRSSTAINSLAAALGLTSEQVDSLFISANELRV